MFGSNRSKPSAPPETKTVAPPPPPAPKPVPPSILAENLKIVGNVASDGDIHIDGAIKGDVHSNQLTVGEKATVVGAITGEHVVVSGTVEGQITATKVTLTATARVTGDINHDTLSIEAGAFIEGLCKRMDSAALAAAVSAAGSDVSLEVKGQSNSAQAPEATAKADVVEISASTNEDRKSASAGTDSAATKADPEAVKRA